jgi:hypothetical protein
MRQRSASTPASYSSVVVAVVAVNVDAMNRDADYTLVAMRSRRVESCIRGKLA